MAEQTSVVGRRSSETKDRKTKGDERSMLRITLIRSLIGRPEAQRKTVRALGLTRMHQSVEQNDTPQIRGMVNQVRHLLKVEEA